MATSGYLHVLQLMINLQLPQIDTYIVYIPRGQIQGEFLPKLSLQKEEIVLCSHLFKTSLNDDYIIILF